MSNIVPIQKDTGVRCSGGELPHGSDKVWAIYALQRGRKKAHFWRRHMKGYLRECDEFVAPAFMGYSGQCTLFGPGDYLKCKRCMECLRNWGA